MCAYGEDEVEEVHSLRYRTDISERGKGVVGREKRSVVALREEVRLYRVREDERTFSGGAILSCGRN